MSAVSQTYKFTCELHWKSTFGVAAKEELDQISEHNGLGKLTHKMKHESLPLVNLASMQSEAEK